MAKSVTRTSSKYGPQINDIPSDPALKWVFKRLAYSKTILDDAYFDRIYPEWARQLSRLHWTPTHVVSRIVDILAKNQPHAKVLDIGSGAGKFCLVGAALSEANFFGIEHRSHLVALSQTLVNYYQVPRVSFIEGNLREIDWTKFNVIYLYNPFQEYKTPYQCIDSTIDLDRSNFDRYIDFTHKQLRQMNPGTLVFTYHGFGGTIPSSYRKILSEFCFKGPLECWIKEVT